MSLLLSSLKQACALDNDNRDPSRLMDLVRWKVGFPSPRRDIDSVGGGRF